MSEAVQTTGVSDNSIGAISYLTLIPAVVFLAIAPYNRSSYVRFHAWQSVALGVVVFLLNFLLSFLIRMPGTGFAPRISVTMSALVGVWYTLIVIWCAVRALNGKRTTLPLIGAWAERQSKR